MAKQQQITHVNFSLLQVKKHILHTSLRDMCYAYITYRALQRSVKFIRTWIDTYYSQYNEEEVKEWCAMMNRIGFPIRFEGKNDDEGYVFVIPVSKYKQKLHLSSALIIIRYLWENHLDEIPKHFFKIMKEVDGITEWEALQMAHPYMGAYGNTNHSLRNRDCQTFISREAIEHQYKNFPIYNEPYPSIIISWGGKVLGKAPALYTERYKFIKEKS